MLSLMMVIVAAVTINLSLMNSVCNKW